MEKNEARIGIVQTGAGYRVYHYGKGGSKYGKYGTVKIVKTLKEADQVVSKHIRETRNKGTIVGVYGIAKASGKTYTTPAPKKTAHHRAKPQPRSIMGGGFMGGGILGRAPKTWWGKY